MNVVLSMINNAKLYTFNKRHFQAFTEQGLKLL